MYDYNNSGLGMTQDIIATLRRAHEFGIPARDRSSATRRVGNREVRTAWLGAERSSGHGHQGTVRQPSHMRVAALHQRKQ